MKNTFFFCLVLIFCHLTAITAQAQSSTNDPKAEAILEAVSKKYKSIVAFHASFLYTLESSGNTKESYAGDLTVKGAKYRLKMGGQEIINNGTTVWTYMKESNEVNITNHEPEEDELSPAKIFTVYKKGYKYVFTEELKEKGVVYEVVDLIPENRNNQIFKIRLFINKKDKSIKNLRVFEKSGNRSYYTITKFDPDDTIDEKPFVFDKTKYKGIEVIDLR
ncbi:MAG: outer membrane lipoprotein carrier protein LolA [Bacteroidota bacterium]